MWTESRRRLPTYLLVGGSGLNVVHACSLFFFCWKKMSTRHAYQWFDGFEVLDVLLRGLWIWNLDMLPRGPIDWSLDVLPRGPMDWNLGHASRGPKIEFWTCFPEVWWFEVRTCFPEVRWIWNLDVLSKGPMVWSLDVLPRDPMDLKFGCAS